MNTGLLIYCSTCFIFTLWYVYRYSKLVSKNFWCVFYSQIGHVGYLLALSLLLVKRWHLLWIERPSGEDLLYPTGFLLLSFCCCPLGQVGLECLAKGALDIFLNWLWLVFRITHLSNGIRILVLSRITHHSSGSRVCWHTNIFFINTFLFNNSNHTLWQVLELDLIKMERKGFMLRVFILIFKRFHKRQT